MGEEEKLKIFYRQNFDFFTTSTRKIRSVTAKNTSGGLEIFITFTLCSLERRSEVFSDLPTVLGWE